jgi:hypothetical protein
MKTISTIQSGIAALKAEAARCGRLAEKSNDDSAAESYWADEEAFELAAEALHWVLDLPWPGLERLAQVLGDACGEVEIRPPEPSDN